MLKVVKTSSQPRAGHAQPLKMFRKGVIQMARSPPCLYAKIIAKKKQFRYLKQEVKQ